MNYYTIFGLTIHSELHLPELVTTNLPPDVQVRLKQIKIQASVQARTARCLTIETEAAKFLVKDGNEIIIELLPDAEEALVRLFLLGPIMAILLRQRGLLVLHGSAVEINQEVVGFLGDSGWGKSTLAGVFHQAGYPIITDDLLVIEMNSQGLFVQPGFPQVKVWPDAADALAMMTENLKPLFRESVKLAYQFKGDFAIVKRPLKRIYLLGNHNPEHLIKAVSPQEAFIHLIRHSRATGLPYDQTLAALHFQQCSRLVKEVDIQLLKRQRSLKSLPEVVPLIEQDLFDSYEHQNQIPLIKEMVRF